MTNFSLYAVSGTCASGWTCGDIGSPTPAGTDNDQGGAWTIQGGGSDIQGTTDRFHYVWGSLPGDGSFSAHVAAQSNTSTWAKAGVMLRATVDPASANYAAFITPGNGVDVQSRAVSGGGTSTFHVAATVPLWLQVSRTGTTFTAYTSPDGSTWTLVPGSTKTLSLTGTLLAGVAVTSHNSAALSTVSADSFTLTGASPPPPPPPPGCPTGWSCADIGAPTPAGTEAVSGSTWTIQGGGSDIQGSADHFQYVWQTASGDGSVVAHVTSQSTANAWSKAGVMLRAGTDPAAANYAVFITPGHGIDVQYRAVNGGGTSSFHLAGTQPLYLEVTRSGSTFSASTSTDGMTWTVVAGSTQTLSLPTSLLGGVAVSSHTTSALCTVAVDTVSA